MQPACMLWYIEGGGGVDMSLWRVVVICSWWCLLANRHLLPFPWSLFLDRQWCLSATHHHVSFPFLLALHFSLLSFGPFRSIGLSRSIKLRVGGA